MFLIKSWLSVKIGKDQKLRYSLCMVMVIEFHNFKILSSLLHGYHIPQLQSIAIPYMAFLSHNFKILPTFTMESFRIGNPSFYFFIIIFLEIGRKYISIMSIIITIVSNITVLVSQNIFFGFFMSMSHNVNKKTPPKKREPHLPLLYQVFTKFSPVCLLFYCDQVFCER